MFDDIAIEPTDPQLGEGLANLAFEPLCPTAQVSDPRRAAGRTSRRDGCRPPAVMASKRRPRLVIDERSFAVRARLDVPAIPAQDDRRRPTPVEDQDGLLAAGRIQPSDRRGKWPRQQTALSRCELGAQVDDLDCWWQARGSDREHHPIVGSGPGAAHAVHGRRGGPENERCAGQFSQADRAVTRLQPGCPVALVGLVVLLVHDHQPHVGERS